MRLFVAVYPPDGVRRDLRRRLGEVTTKRLTALDKWHITLAFLGEVAPEDVPEAERALATVTVPKGRELRIRGGGSFHRRVTWAGVAGELGDVAADVRAALADAGVPCDIKPFAPHLTVMYAHDEAVLVALADYAGPAWTLDGIELVRSEGGTYTTLWAG